jgi:glycine oxidase
MKNVTIIGAGIVGYAVAYELASRGASVRIIDPRGAGHGATRASAGVLAPYIEGHSEQLLKLAVCGLASYDAFIARLRADSQRPVEYRRNGTLQVARGQVEAATLEDAARRLSAAGVGHSLVDAGGVKDLEPGLAADVSAGLLVDEHGYVGVAALIAALVDAVDRRGGTLSRASVTAVERTASGIRVLTSDGSLDTDAVIIAAGSWSGTLVTPPVPVRPIRGQLLQVRFAQPPLSRVVWGSACYLVPWSDGSVLIGATVEDVGFDERATAGGMRHLLESAADLLPASATAAFDEVRVGLRPFTSDELPVIGPSSTMRGVYYATGHYRNGVLLAPLTATLVADLVLEGRERPELALVAPGRLGL